MHNGAICLKSGRFCAKRSRTKGCGSDGLAGYYTIALHWAPVDTTNPSTTEVSAPQASEPSVFAAVKEQLGFELKPIKGPLDTIVIDHAEMPSEN